MKQERNESFYDWYIDFDSTLYNTSKLTSDMLNEIAEYISKNKNIDKIEILSELKSIFNRENIYNIFTLCTYFENKYELQTNILSKQMNKILENGSKYIYKDVPSFLNNLKKNQNTVYLLTSVVGTDNMKFQNLKISGSGIANFFDCIIITAKPKYELDLLYSNGVFVDDNPEDLKNLYNAKAKKTIRIKRPNAKYSNKELNIPQIEEYTTLSNIIV